MYDDCCEYGCCGDDAAAAADNIFLVNLSMPLILRKCSSINDQLRFYSLNR